MSIYFLRHIKTVYNKEKIISGCAEAEILPNQSIVYQSSPPENFEYIFCSPLSRCKETLNLLPSSLISTDIRFLECLIERNLGILEGLKKECALSTYPYLFHNKMIDVNVQIPQAECIDDVKKRLFPLLSWITIKQLNNNILICSHNQTLKVLYSIANNIPITNEYWENFNFENGTLIKLEDVYY